MARLKMLRRSSPGRRKSRSLSCPLFLLLFAELGSFSCKRLISIVCCGEIETGLKIRKSVSSIWSKEYEGVVIGSKHDYAKKEGERHYRPSKVDESR